MRAVLFGTFNAQHAANVLLVEELRAAGVEVRVCHAPLWEETRDKQASYFAPVRLVGLGLRWVWLMARLALRFRYAAAGAEVIVVGFNGQLDVLVARLLAGGRRVVFAPLVTVSETLVEDRAVYAAGSGMARILRGLDRLTLAAADIVVSDTAAHAEWMARELDVPRERITVHLLGAEEVFRPAAQADQAASLQPGPRLRVFGYASYLPLHGMDVIARAARALAPEEGIAFVLVGDGPERARVAPLLEGLPHVSAQHWLPQDEIVSGLHESDLVLGIFGHSAKAAMVIPNKVWQAAAAGCAIVTSDTPAIREVFEPGVSILTCEPEPDALAERLRAAAKDRGGLGPIGAAARDAAARKGALCVRAARWRNTLGMATAGQESA